MDDVSAGERSVVRTFLIADVRGYTRFTQEQGDEAAGALAARFATIARDVVESHDGTLLELRGDEALCVFDSPRQALRTALTLQARFVEETLADPALPLGVGIGVDSGEAVAVQSGYRGGALNMAARLCSVAKAGEILATGEAVHLARRIEGVDYVDRGPVQLKGVDEPPRVMRVSTRVDDPTKNPAFRAAVQQPPPPKRRGVPLLVVAGVAIVVAAVIAVVVTTRGGNHGLADIGSNAVGAVSISGNTLHRTVHVGVSPGAIAADATSVWVANTADNTVSRIDLTQPTAPANTIPVGDGPSGIALGFGAAWVSNVNERSVSRINEKSNKVVDTVHVGTGPTALAVGAGRVWVANGLDDTISVVDPSTDRVESTIAVGAVPSAVAYGLGSVWVASAGSSSVVRIDPARKLVTAAISVGNGPQGLTVDPTGIWVTNTLDDTVSHIDPAANRVVATVPVGHEPTGTAASGDAVWVANSDSNTISRIDPKANRVEQTITVGNAPQAVAVTDGDAWVSARGSAAAHRGGTLRIVAGSDETKTLDPAATYNPLGWQLLSMMNDGLLTYQRTAGPAGAQVVPDLASGLPVVADNGRTYTFQLRSGLRYSDGTPVRASDFRASLERLQRLREAPPFYTGIIGANSCTPRHCDLRRGIAADDQTGTITIHLSAPDPEFLYKLALPLTDFLPPSTPNRDLRFAPHVATGPYVMVSATRRHIVLARNPRFRMWSAAAQPAGYPDRFDISIVKEVQGSAAQADNAAVAAGRFDWTPDRAAAGQLAALVRTKTDQVHPYTSGSDHYYFLNTRESPLDDVRVRRAVNLALDRRAAVARFGGPLRAQLTCQIVPPVLYGYHPYCPYTAHPNAGGTWSAPDRAAGRRLVAAAHATGAKVTVVARPDYPQIGRLIVATMRSIGLDAKLYLFPDQGASTGTAYYGYIGRRGNRVQTALEGWQVDFPEPSNMISPLLSCSAIAKNNDFELNESLFCDHHIDSQMRQALTLQSTNPAAAAVQWARIDHEITDRAPWIFLVNDRQADVVSSRLGNYERNPQFGMLLDQVWI